MLITIITKKKKNTAFSPLNKMQKLSNYIDIYTKHG